VCHNATVWTGGALQIGAQGSASPANTQQPFIFATGPGSYGPGADHGGADLQSDSPSAGLKRHELYGFFTMDISKALSATTAAAGVPRPNGENNIYLMDAATFSSMKNDHDPAPAIHAFVMCLSFVVLFPLGSLILRVLHRVILHAVVQAIGLFLVVCATAGGIVISMEYNRSKHFASAHQVIGILLFLALLSQLGLGIVHHRIYKKEQRPTIMGKIHLYLGPTIIFFGIINAPIGFVFAGNPHLCLPYVIILVLFILIYVGVRFGASICCKGRRNKQRTGGIAGAPASGPEGYQYPQFAPSPYEQPPPAYGRQPSYGPGEDVPLRPYASQTSGLGQPPAYPRPMV